MKPTRIQKERRLLVLVALACFFGAMFILVKQAQARPPVPPHVFKAVREQWKTRAERVKAFDVVSCETGGAYNTTAENGEYENIFQMGLDERRRYGWHVAGSSARLAARAAHRLYIARGWRPWSACA